jgi:hypothetical protein
MTNKQEKTDMLLFQNKKYSRKGDHYSSPGYIPVIIICLSLVIADGCLTPYNPEITKYNKALVVDGLLTNIPGTCKVDLSRTYPYDNRHGSSEKGAQVKIVDDIGNEIRFTDNDDGHYLPEDKDFAGKIGKKYKISILTAEGEVCESGFEELKEPVDIENLYYEYHDKGNGNQGLQVYIDTYDRLKASFYYAWDYEETWEFWVPYASTSDYLPEIKICYNDVSSRKLLIESTKDYTEDKVMGFPLYFIGNNTNRLSVKYSVLVRQYILSESTYRFFKNLKLINENSGTLFDPTPVSITGNVHNVHNAENPVLGNFQVSGASEKRIFILKDELPRDMVIPTEFEFCKQDMLSKKTNRSRIDSLIGKGWAVMDTVVNANEKDTLIGLAISRACFDCRIKGKTEKPGFWNK